MVVDSWTLFDGDDIYPPGGKKSGAKDSDYHKEVNRIAWFGMGSNPPFLGELGSILSGLQQFLDVMNIDWPFQTRVASIASRGEVKEANTIEVDTDVGQRKFHTTSIREEWDEMSSEFAKTYDARGDYYMGNKEAQKDCGN